MTIYAALLRAINVGGTGKLTMAELRALCEETGLKRPRTYIQTGNVLFESGLGEAAIKKKLERTLASHMGKPVGVLLRTVDELEAIVRTSPFPDAPPNRVIILFLDAPPPSGALRELVTDGGERLVALGRETFIHYPNGMGKSKLKIPFAKIGTGRNLNTVAKLALLAREVEAR
jgi:uncharacterized protein (DUF1697 family)